MSEPMGHRSSPASSPASGTASGPRARLAAVAADRRRVAINAWNSDMVDTWVLSMMGHPFPPHLIGKPHIVETIGLDPGVRERVEEIRETSLRGLTEGLLIAADSEMCALIDAAAPTMPDQPLVETDMIAPAGFVWFADPLPDRSGTQPQMPTSALSWITLPADHPMHAERISAEVNPDGAPVVLIHTYTRMTDIPGAPPMNDPRLAGKVNLFPSSSTAWVMGTLIGSVYGEAPPPGPYAPGFYQRLTATFWALVQQPLTSTTHEPPGDKAARRKAARVGVRDPGAPVHVIALRRSGRVEDPAGAADTTAAEGTGRKMSVRAMTRGHWRNQWYPSTKLHRQTWISAHWRGPEDAPVVGGERVFLASGPKEEPPRERH